MRSRGIAGFTLIELLVSLAVLGILAAVVVPGLAQFGHAARMSMLGNRFLGDLAHARSEAIKRGKRVVVCKSINGVVCTTTGHWDGGWMVFEDSNNNGRREATETRLSVVEAQPPGWRVKGTFSGAHYVSYHPMGRSQLVSGAMQGGTLTICRTSAQPTDGLQVVISLAGRPRSQRATVSSCV